LLSLQEFILMTFTCSNVLVYDLELSRRLCTIKSSRATSRVKWLNGEKTNVSRTTLVFSPFNHLTQLVAREDFIVHSRRESSTRRVLDSTHQSPLASAQPWAWGSGRYIWHGWELQPLQYPEDEDRDGPRNTGFFLRLTIWHGWYPRRFYCNVMVIYQWTHLLLFLG
jgi:hypothetical protein